MKNQLKKSVVLFAALAFVFFGCSASEVTEEYEGGQKDVVYQTEKPAQTQQTETATPQPTATEVTPTTQPEYIPQGPPTPPPPPLKVNLSSEESKEQPTTESKPVETSPQYLYKVQVFAFKSRLNAESEAQKIRKRMPDQKVYVEFQDNLYKVRLGIYSKWEHAKGIKDALFNLGYTDSFIVTEVKQ
ncbi:MAG: SPOR domain-containing protein [Ignavibacteria bacterium]|jgi:cell division protein FtsN|nr:SPOR domain-containing protein [Ignavibacteria bacterium]MDH7528782.1 SPOR domain-containing protein [Ignavibacteria bacterium]